MDSDLDSTPLLLLGEEEARYGAYRLEVLPTGRTAAVLSVGADRNSPALAHKGARGIPNEDALLAFDQGDRALLVVADAHHGSQASHVLLRRLSHALERIPGNPAQLQGLVGALAEDDGLSSGASRTSLLLAVLRRDLGAAFGLSYGDCSCAALGPSQQGERLNVQNTQYVSPGEPASLGRAAARFFECDVPAGAVLLAFSDGIDECAYRRPGDSLGPAQYRQLFREAEGQVQPFAQALVEAALAGRPGRPGGQDNIALVVSAC